MQTLIEIETTVQAGEGDAILGRWHFGREVLTFRKGSSRLPTGLPQEICKRAGINDTELFRRIRLAEIYPTEEEIMEASKGFATWREFINNMPKAREAKKPKTAPRRKTEKPPKTTPTATTFRDADRVEQLLAKPDVAFEIKGRSQDRRSTRVAQKVIEQREKEEAREQKEQDQYRQELMHVARRRLVQGDTDWQNLVEIMEITKDTVRRYLELWPGLTLPEPLRQKTIDRELGALQQALMEMRQRLRPDYNGVSGDLPAEHTGSIIVVN